MQTKIKRISRRTVSMVLALLMMVSILGFGSLITADAASYTIYFDDTNTNWGSVYVWASSSSYWNNSNGSGSNGRNVVKMSKVSGTTNLWKATVSATGYVCFTKHKQENYEYFYKNKAAYRGDFSSSKPVFIPSSTKSGTYNQTDYYSNGQWTYAPVTYSENAVVYYKMGTWWTNTPCHEYVGLVTFGASTSMVPAYNLTTYLNGDNATNGNKSSSGSGTTTTYFATIPAGTYYHTWFERKKSDSASADYYNATSGTYALSASKNINTTALVKDSTSFTLNSTTYNAPIITATASSTSVNTGVQVTLDASMTKNADLNVLDSVSYAVTSANSGTATIAGNKFSATAGGTYTVTATGTYHAKGYSSLSHTVTDTIDITVTVPTHSVTASTPSNGTLYVDTSSTVGTGTSIAAVAEGSTYYIKAKPNTGYKLTDISVNNSSIYSTEETDAKTVSRTMGAANETVTATFTLKTYTISYASGANGTGTVDSTSKNHGTDVTLSSSTFTSSREGYEQDGWSTTDGGDKAYNLGGTYSANASTTLYPHWKLKTYTVNKTETGASNGTVTVGGTTITTGEGVSINYGTNYTVAITAPANYNVTAVSGISGDVASGALNTGAISYSGVSITANTTIAVTYAAATTPGVTVTADYDNSSNKANIGSTVTVTATKTHPTGSAGTMQVAVKRNGSAATVNTDYTISTSTSGNVTTYTIVPKNDGTFQVTASYTDTGNPSSSVTFGVNTPTITVANNNTIKIGQSYTISPTITNTSGSGWAVVYTATDGSAATVSGSSITAVTTGSAGFSASLQYNGVQKAATTFSVTPVTPTVAFGSTAQQSINIGGTHTRTASRGSSEVGTVTSDSVTYESSNTTVATVDGSGVVTGKTPGTSDIKAKRTIVCNGKTTTVDSSTYTITVNTPAVSLSGDNKVAVGNTKTLTPAVTNVTGTPTYTYVSSDESKATVNNSGVVTGVAAGSTTITVTATLGTWSDTATKSITVENPELVIKDSSTTLDGSSVLYMTVGGSKTLTNNSNFTDTVYFYSSKPAVATINETTGAISALAKGSTTITVTTVRNASLASASRTKGKGKYATGSVAAQSMTFTVNVSEADTDKFILFTNNYSWSSPQIYYQYKIGNAATQTVGLTAMTKLGTNNSNQSIYGYKMPIEHYNNLTLLIFAGDTNWSTQTVDITSNLKTNTAYYISGDGESEKKRTVGAWTAPAINIPQVTIDDATTALGTNYTMTATPVTSGTVGKYTWSSGTTSVATVTENTGTTASTTITPVDAGTSTITVNAYAPKPATDFKTWDFASIVSSSDTATMTVTADDRTVTYSQKVSYDGTSYNAPGAGVTPGTLTVTKTTGGAAVANGSTVPHNTSVTFAASANSGYKFVGWEVDGVVDSPLSTADKVITVNADKDVKALFDRGVTVTFKEPATPGNNSTIQTGFVYYGASPVAPADPSHAGYAFDGWSTDGGTTKLTKADVDATTISGAADITYVAQYSIDYKTVTYGKQSTSNGTDYTDDASAGTISAVTGYRAPTEGSEDPTPAGETLYLWWGRSGAPSNYTNNVTMEQGSDGNYYATLPAAGDGSRQYYFVINNSSTSSLTGTQKITSSTTSTSDNTFYWADRNTYSTWDIGRCQTTYELRNNPVYIKYDPTGNGSIRFQTSSFSYTPAGGGGTPADPGDPGTPIGASPANVQKGQTVRFSVDSVASGYEFVGWYRDNVLTSSETVANITVNANMDVYARFKKVYYITLYDSYVQETDGSFTFIASPPRQVKVGSTTYTYKAGTAEQRGEENIADPEDGIYYEGNKIAVNAGDTIELSYSTLASSEDFKGIYYNNAIRYTTEEEVDNLYLNRVNHGIAAHGGNGTGTLKDDEHPEKGYTTGDDDWDYDYATGTTLYASSNYYDGAAKTAVQNLEAKNADAEDSYKFATVDHENHTVQWTAQGNYYNIDLELASKYKIYINGDDYSGLDIKNFNTEGYYFNGENFTKVVNSVNKVPEIGLDTTVDDCTFSWTDTTATAMQADGTTAASGITVTGVKSNGSSDGLTTDNLDHFKIEGTMPAYDVYIKIPVEKTYNMKLSNIVVADNIGNKAMLTQTTLKTHTNTTTTPASFTGNVGTIAAYDNYNSDGDDNDANETDISKDAVNHWYYNSADYNNEGTSGIYENNSSSHNYYLAGGVNKTGSNVTAGHTVTYKFTYASGMDANYSFVGWFEGSYNSTTGQFTPDYTKKLSGNKTYTLTPKKNMVVIAVGTRDIYIGGNFTSNGVYTTTAADQTWKGNRIRMSYDPTYVKPGDSSKIGRYYYTFNSVTANTEYKFRCYDTVGTGASGQDFTNLTVWNSYLSQPGDCPGYNQDNPDIACYRDKYDSGQAIGWTTHGGFMYTTATGRKITTAREQGGDEIGATHTISANHQTNGYAAPVTVYFYAYDGGMSVESTFQWAEAYVSPGVGVDVLKRTYNNTDYTNEQTLPAGATSENTTTTFNSPVVEVANKTVGTEKDVTGTSSPVTIGESVYHCTVKEKDGTIRVTACPQDDNLDVEAFVVYNLDTKEAKAVKDITATTKTISSTTYNAFYADIQIKQNKDGSKTKVYIVPVYKFTDTYMSTNSSTMEEHTVYVNAEDMDTNVWGGLVAMYSWGTTVGFKSSNYPGQLLIPSDDGKSFYGQLQYYNDGLAGVLFANYCDNNFISNYHSKKPDGTDASSDDDRISTTVYCTNTSNVQTYDYCEPISIINNLNDESIKDSYYHVDDMDLTFALKSGNKTSNPSDNATSGDNTLDGVASWEYLTDRSGQNRVDFNGKTIKTNPTATYRVVCQYIKGYKNHTSKTYAFNPAASDTMEWAVDWYVYDNEKNLLNSGTTDLETSGQSGTLSASYVDVNKDYMMTEIASILSSQGLPVSGKAVQIAYENPTTFTGNTVRYSGQWYSDPLNSLINANVRIGTLSDGVFTPTTSNVLGETTATVDISKIATPADDEGVSTETGCTGNSKATVIKSNASKNRVTLTVNNTDDFQGWYTYDEESETYILQSEDASFSPSFNSDITYYAFYSAAAYYEFKYTGRDGGTHTYSVKGKLGLQEEDFAKNGKIQKSAARMADVETSLGGVSSIKVFNRTFTYTIDAAHANNDTPYKLIFTDAGTANEYTLTAYTYNGSGALTTTTENVGGWGTVTNLDGALLNNKPSGHSDYVFIGWKEYNPTGSVWGDLVSTNPNFGYTLTGNLTVAAWFGTQEDKDTAMGGNWNSYVDKNEITQELTGLDSGVIYNDSLLRFQYGGDTQKMIYQDGYNKTSGLMDTSNMPNGAECGLLIIAQNKESAAEKGGTFTDPNNNRYLLKAPDGSTKTRVQTYADNLRTNNLTSAKLNSASYGTTYAYRTKISSLSRLNRTHIYQALDYANFNGGNYIVMAYYFDGTNTYYSDPIVSTYTPGQKYPAA